MVEALWLQRAGHAGAAGRVEPVMWWTFASTIVATATALFIALVIYPWQKRKDRESEIMRERRAAYVDYSRAYKKLIFCQPFLGDEYPNTEFLSIGDIEQSYYIARDTVYLLAPDFVADLVAKHEKVTRSWVVAHSESMTGEATSSERIRPMYAEMQRLFRDAMNGFRTDLQEQTSANLVCDFRSFKTDSRPRATSK